MIMKETTRIHSFPHKSRNVIFIHDPFDLIFILLFVSLREGKLINYLALLYRKFNVADGVDFFCHDSGFRRFHLL